MNRIDYWAVRVGLGLLVVAAFFIIEHANRPAIVAAVLAIAVVITATIWERTGRT